jgi:hypothetical protein
MSFTPTNQLTHTSNVNIRDSQTASRLFVSDQFRLAPKFKFLFHVAFSINQAALMNINLVQRHKYEIDMLVKSCDLPSFEMKTETLNQYNRKKVIQLTHTYNPISMVFHDDNMGVINQLWQNYYNYYYADPSSSKDPGAYARNAMKNFSYIKDTYGLNNGSTLPFFNYIKVYQMARHEYVCYTLHNPIISKWNHNKVDYYQTSVHDNTMEIMYEAVSYSSGNVTSGDPEGFDVEHYDDTPSPLQGGANTSATPSFVPTTSGNSGEFISNLVTTYNTYQNTQSNLPTSSTPGVIQNVLGSAGQGVSGVQGITFPTNYVPSDVTNASVINL